MSKHFQNEIEKLKKKILLLTAMVEENLLRAVKALVENNENLVKEVIAYDVKIDTFEVEVEEECLKILALHQPVAVDLRYVVAVLKITSDLERIGDLAVNISKRTSSINLDSDRVVPINLYEMLDLTLKLVKDAIDAMVENDTQLAKQVCLEDDEIDDIHKNSIKILKENIKKNPQRIDFYLSLLNVSRNLERIADHATNIAEDVIYNIDGQIVRHKGSNI